MQPDTKIYIAGHCDIVGSALCGVNIEAQVCA